VQNLADHGALLAAIADGRMTSTDDERTAVLTSIDIGEARLRSATTS
jgi:hypothetical protein